MTSKRSNTASAKGRGVSPSASVQKGNNVGNTTADGLTVAELTEAFEYLDELRKDGSTNMYAASAYVVRDLSWPKHEATAACKAWRDTFDADATVDMRVARAIGGDSA